MNTKMEIIKIIKKFKLLNEAYIKNKFKVNESIDEFIKHGYVETIQFTLKDGMLDYDDFCEAEVLEWFKNNIDKIKLLEDCINLCIDESFYCDEAKINIISCLKDIMMEEYYDAFDKELMELERETKIIKNQNYDLPW
jgi:hypothetical protein